MSPSETVVLHVSDAPADVARALGSARTLREADLALTVRIIVNGAALDGLASGAHGVEIPGAEFPDGTTVEACRIGMGKRGIPADALRPGVGIVPAAVVAIVEAQQSGASYVRI
ncbi:hypothetical protein [Microbacterium sp.]|uniref:DsrE family protein n=1 Tax=Microbacterium sp. TaxID=51671 RepID=UPI00333F447C